jgi:hypothetical protein
MSHAVPNLVSSIADLRALHRSVENDRFGAVTARRAAYFDRTDWLRAVVSIDSRTARQDDFSDVLREAFAACARILRAVWQQMHGAELGGPAPAQAPSSQPTRLPDGAGRRTRRGDLKRHLVATMLLGRMYRRQADVDVVFAAVSRACAQARELRVGLAFASSMGGDNQLARDLLDAGFDDWPHPELSLLSTALALKVGQDPEWLDIVNRVQATSADQKARQFARRLLETA